MRKPASKPDKTPPPAGLSLESQRWWRKLTDEYAIDDPAGWLLLETALQAFDRMREAQVRLAEDGIVVMDRFGQPKSHPATVVERDSRSAMLAALRALHLDLEPLQPRVGRPGA